MLINYHLPKQCPECKSNKLSTARVEQEIDVKKGATLFYVAPIMICDNCSFRWEQPIVEHMRETFSDWVVDLEMNREINYANAH